MLASSCDGMGGQVGSVCLSGSSSGSGGVDGRVCGPGGKEGGETMVSFGVIATCGVAYYLQHHYDAFFDDEYNAVFASVLVNDRVGGLTSE